MTGDGAGSGGTGDMDREVERLSSDLLDRRVPSADAPTSPAAPATPPPATPAAPPVDVVLEGLEDISADLEGLAAVTRPTSTAASAAGASTQRAVDSVVASITGTQPGPGTVGPAGNVSADGLRTVAAMTANAPAVLAEPLDADASFWQRHDRNVAMAGIAIVAMAVFIAALLALQGDGGAPGNPADPAALAQASAVLPADPSVVDTSPVDPSPVGPSPVAPSDEPTLEPIPTPEPTPIPSPAPGNVTIRGPIDASEVSWVDLRVGTHEVLLSFDSKGGPVSGTFTIEIKEFPIGSLLTATFDGEKDPDYDAFKKCTVTMALVGQANGTYDAATGKMSGKAAFKAAADDVDDCLKTRPSNISIDPDKVAKPTSVKWRAKFNGTRATGSLDMEPVMDFSATIED